MSVFRNLPVRSYRHNAAETDMLKLSVNPTMGILTNSSALFITILDNSDNSEPKNRAIFPLCKFKSCKRQSFVCGVVVTILKPSFF